MQILNCYNTGSVTGATCVGGIAGKHTGGTDPTVTNCYNTGSVKGASCGALVGEYAAEIRNSYYLEGSASAATGNTKDGVNVEATAKTAAEMKETAFVLALGNEAFHQDDGRNGGYPLLAWQGGTHVVNTAAAEAIRARRKSSRSSRRSSPRTARWRSLRRSRALTARSPGPARTARSSRRRAL